MNHKFGITEQTHTLDGKIRISFGIAVYSDPESEGTATILESVGDISSNRQNLLELIDKCNSLELSIIHLYDVIEDFWVS